MLKLGFLFLLAVVASCGKAPDMPETKQKSSSDSLQGKTEEEVVEIKYKEPFRLECAIRVMKGEFINLNVRPSDQFSLGLNEDLSLMRVLHYKIGRTEMVAVVKIVAAPEILPYVIHRTETFREFEMENSPVLRIKYRRAPRRTLLNGTIHDQNAYSEVKLYENIENRIFTISSEAGSDLETDDLRCKLVTKMNPKFSDQWKEIF